MDASEEALQYVNLDLASDCNCIDGAAQDQFSTFALKTNKKNLRAADFKSKWEKTNMLTQPENCENCCGEKGVSLSKVNSENCMQVLGIYQELFPLMPNYKPFFTLICLNNMSGAVKLTKTPKNEYHYDLFKSDVFDVTQVQFLGSDSLHP